MSATSEIRRIETSHATSPVYGDQYTYIALGASTRAIIGYRTGKRDARLQTILFRTCASG